MFKQKTTPTLKIPFRRHFVISEGWFMVSLFFSKKNLSVVFFRWHYISLLFLFSFTSKKHHSFKSIKYPPKAGSCSKEKLLIAIIIRRHKKNKINNKVHILTILSLPLSHMEGFQHGHRRLCFHYWNRRIHLPCR